MGILSRYLTRLYLLFFSMVTPALVGIYLVAAMFEKLDDFIESGTSARDSALFFLLIVPRIFQDLGPMIILLSGLLAIVHLSRHQELTAMRSLGVAPTRIMATLLASAAVAALIFLCAQVSLIPASSAKAHELWNTKVKQETSKGIFRAGRLFYHGEDTIWSADLANPQANWLKGVEWISFDKRYRPRTMIASMEAVYEEGHWTFLKGIKKVFSPGEPKVNPFLELVQEMEERPKDFLAMETPVDQQGLIELWKGLRRLKRSGYDVHQLETQFWGCVFFPFRGVGRLAAGLPLALAYAARSMGMGIAMGMAIGFSVWTLWGFLLTLGKTGKIPPLAGPLMTIAALGFASIWLTRRYLR